MNCDICINQCKVYVTCTKCSNITCIKCFIIYSKIQCPSCNEEYCDALLLPVIKKKKVMQIYKLGYIRNRISDIDNSMLSMYDIMCKNKQLLRYGTQIKKNNSISVDSFLCFCPVANCKGIISSNNQLCLFCGNQICDICHSVKYNTHVCNEYIVKSINELKNSGKNCPICFTFIIKSEGCNDMFCTKCGTRFCWRTGQIQKKNTNNHYKQLSIDPLPLNNNELIEIPIRKSINDNEVYGFLIKAINFLNKFQTNIIIAECNYYNSNTNNHTIKRLYELYKMYDFMSFIRLNIKQNTTVYEIDNLTKNYYSTNILPNVCKFICKDNKIVKFNKVPTIYTNSNNQLCENNITIELLDDYQIEHANVIKSILDKYGTAFDRSVPGSGKSYIALYVAKQLAIEYLLVIVPPSIVNKWNSIISKYNGHNNFKYIVMSTCKLYVNANYTNNNLLIRDTKYYNGYSKVFFHPTSELESIFKHKVLVILDESHIVRSKNSLFLKAILSVVKLARSKNQKILNISATPTENISQLITIVQKMGIIESCNYNSIYNIITYILNIYKLDELQDYLNTYKILYKSIYSKDSIIKEIILKCNNKGLTYNESLKIVDIYRSNSMYKLIDILFAKLSYASSFNHGKINAYVVSLRISEYQKYLLQLAFTNLDARNVNNTLDITSVVTKGLMQVETALLDSIYNMTDTILKSTNCTKVVIAMNFVESIKDIINLLGEYNPLIITGHIKNKSSIISLFQNPSVDHRLLIVNMSCINVGLDLDDKYGSFPRYVLVVPNYVSINIYQFIHRFLRIDSKSKPIIHIINSHINIMSNLICKAKIQHSIFDQIKLIDSLPQWIESDDNVQELIEYFTKHE